MDELSGFVLRDASNAGNDGLIANQPYVSGVLDSYPNYTFKYGYFEARMQNPYGQGLWPAFWLYATSGTDEIDVMEQYGSTAAGNMTTIYQTVQNCSGCQVAYTGVNPTTGFHRYGAEWTSSGVKFFIDGIETGSFARAMSAPMYLIMNLQVAGPGWGANYRPSPSEFPAKENVSGVWAYRPRGRCSANPMPEPTPLGTASLPRGDICVDGTSYVPEIPPTDDFSSLNQYGSTNPAGTWQTRLPWGSVNNGTSGAAFYADNSPGRFEAWPFTTGRSGLTITARVASHDISGFNAPPLASGARRALTTLGAVNGICATCGSNYLRSGYVPVSGSFSLTCYISVPPIRAGHPILLGTGNPQTINHEGFALGSDRHGDVDFAIGYGAGAGAAVIHGGLPSSTPESLVVTYNDATRIATLYAGRTSSPRSMSVRLPASYVASGAPVYFNAGMYNFYQGATFDDCAEWDGTVLTTEQAGAIAADTL
jgi:beta-glucanase (GH16 family)